MGIGARKIAASIRGQLNVFAYSKSVTDHVADERADSSVAIRIWKGCALAAPTSAMWSVRETAPQLSAG